MSEMLGNRYFIARQFDKAIPFLEAALNESAFTDKIKKKLIICYIQENKAEKAFDIFYEIVCKNPRIISDTDVIYDDCPCFELIPMWKKRLAEQEAQSNLLKILGMLSLYCDVQKSIEYFSRSLEKSDKAQKIQTILKKLQTIKAEHA